MNWVFDLDGTLVDSFGHYFALLDRIFKRNGSEFTDEMRHPALTQSLHGFFEAHLGASAVDASLAELQSRSNEDALKIKAYPGMLELLVDLRSRGSRVAVWTNRDLVSAQLILQSSGLAPLVEHCVSGTCTSRRKPHPEGLLEIRERFACKAKEMTMVGDHEHDVMGALTAGMRAVRASWHAYWPVERCSRADFQFHDVTRFQTWALSAD